MKKIASNQPRFKSLFLFCFFFSGACGLIYQVAWLRVLSLVFGNTTFATSTILSSYMAGLGLGALYFGRRIDDESRHPVRIYAWLEGGVALYAFITPLLWKLIEFFHVGLYHTFSPDYLTAALFKFFMAFAALFVPTFLMGGTLPVVSRYFVSHRADTARYVGLLYALNTLGAVVGVVFSGFYSLYHFGVWQTVYLAGAANLIIFFAMKDFGKNDVPAKTRPNPSATTVQPAAPPEASDEKRSLMMTGMLFLFGCSGAVSMMYEIGWTRVLAIVLGSSTYAFSVMLATFLLGIALGSYLFSFAARRWKIDFFAFSVMQLLTAASVLWGINQFDDIPYWFVQVFNGAKGEMLWMELGRFMICASVMLVPTVFIGALFTCFIQAYRGSGKLGKDVGVAYFSNTVGTILGAALTGFLIVPAIGIQQTLLLGASINAVIGVLTFIMMPENRVRIRLAAGGAALLLVFFTGSIVQPWNKSVIASDTAVNPTRIVGLTKDQFLASLREREILFYKEGLSATVSVAKVKDNVSLAVNGKVDASNSDAFTQYLLGHLPLLLHENPKRVAVIGLGSASTLAAVAAHPVERIDSVELEKAVVEASDFFPDLNRGVLRDPRVHQYVNDGRNFILVSPDKYDVIISEPSNPWMAGVANLFSLQHFETMKQRLNEGGMVCQWLHAYSMSPEDLSMIMKTFAEAFPYVQLWTSYYPDLMLMGYTEPMKVDFERLKNRFQENPVVAADLAPHGIRTPEALISSFWLDDDQIRLLSNKAQTHSDNLPRLEFSAPRNLYARTFDTNYVFLNALRSFDYQALDIQPRPSDNLHLYQEVASGLMAKKMYRDVEQVLGIARSMAPDHPRTLALSGMLDLRLDKTEEAKVKLLSAVKADPSIAEAHLSLSQISMKDKAYDQALEYARTALALDPDSEAYQEAVAEALFFGEKWQEALPLFEKILEKRGGQSFGIMTRIVDITMKTGTDEEKIGILRKMSAKYPKYPVIYLELGNRLEAMGRLPEAVEAFETLTGLVPEDPGFFLSLARIYDKLGMPDQMIGAVKKAVKQNPSLANHPEIRKILVSR